MGPSTEEVQRSPFPYATLFIMTVDDSHDLLTSRL